MSQMICADLDLEQNTNFAPWFLSLSRILAKPRAGASAAYLCVAHLSPPFGSHLWYLAADVTRPMAQVLTVVVLGVLLDENDEVAADGRRPVYLAHEAGAVLANIELKLINVFFASITRST